MANLTSSDDGPLLLQVELKCPVNLPAVMVETAREILACVDGSGVGLNNLAVMFTMPEGIRLDPVAITLTPYNLLMCNRQQLAQLMLKKFNKAVCQ